MGDFFHWVGGIGGPKMGGAKLRFAKGDQKGFRIDHHR